MKALFVPKLSHVFTTDFSWLTQIFFFHSRLYQVRCSLKVSPKLPVQIETCIPEANTAGTTSPCIVGGIGASKVFQILYRNEEVSLKDVIMFRAHLLGNKNKLLCYYATILVYYIFSFQHSIFFNSLFACYVYKNNSNDVKLLLNCTNISKPLISFHNVITMFIYFH